MILNLINEQYIIFALMALFLILLIWIIILEFRIKRLLRGTNAKSIESHIAKISKDYEFSKSQYNAMAKNAEKLFNQSKSAIRGIGLQRFHPFAGSGDSKPSFALALLNEFGNGIIISTLHARNGITIYSKEVFNFNPKSEITQEEREALEKARNSLHNS